MNQINYYQIITQDIAELQQIRKVTIDKVVVSEEVFQWLRHKGAYGNRLRRQDKFYSCDFEVLPINCDYELWADGQMVGGY